MPNDDDRIKSHLAGLIDTLLLLTAQARAYDRALPSDNYHARAAVAAMEKLAQQAFNEAQDLAELLEAEPTPSNPLSPREQEVLKLVSEGLTNKAIAYRLGLSQRTIQFHLNSIFNKTDTASRTEATAVAFRQGWL